MSQLVALCQAIIDRAISAPLSRNMSGGDEWAIPSKDFREFCASNDWSDRQACDALAGAHVLVPSPAVALSRNVKYPGEVCNIRSRVFSIPAAQAVVDNGVVATQVAFDSSSSYVYAIQAGTSGPVKFGFSKDPLSRFTDIQTAHYEKLRLIVAVPGTMDDEQAVHAQLSQSRCRGEWFYPTSAVMRQIRKMVQSTGAVVVSQ